MAWNTDLPPTEQCRARRHRRYMPDGSYASNCRHDHMDGDHWCGLPNFHEGDHKCRECGDTYEPIPYPDVESGYRLQRMVGPAMAERMERERESAASEGRIPVS